VSLEEENKKYFNIITQNAKKSMT